MACEFKIKRRVEFSETDLAGIMHFSNFFRFMESAEHAFFRSLGFSIDMHNRQPPIGWPRVHSSCDFKAPLRFEDEVEVHLVVVEKRRKSLTYEFIFRKLGGGEPLEVARGKITVVSVTRGSDGRMVSCEIPADVAAAIEVAPSATALA
jgi:YbgC/YbaW family acyl-CoA thioester hydrolase